MAGFYSFNQKELVAPYFDKFYDILQELNQGTTYKYFETFFFSLLPRMEVKDEHIVKLLSLKMQTPDTNSNFSNMLNDGDRKSVV